MKKIMTLVIVISLLFPSGALLAKERQGAQLVITKTDGTEIKGELIGVKDRSLMLIDGSGAYVSCTIDETNMIVIGKKSKFSSGAVPGFILGAIGGAVIGSYVAEPKPPQEENVVTSFAYAIEEKAAPVVGGVAGGVLGGLIGLTIGGIISSSIGGPQETFLVEGKSQEQIKAFLEKLRTQARFPEYQ